MNTKEVKLGTLIKEADEIFSKFIRYRDMKDGVIRCFICGISLRFNEAQNMHFIDRDHMPTRYDELNSHAGCQWCNCYDPVHKERYFMTMVSSFGGDLVEKLLKKSNGLQKFMRFELQEIIDKYKILVAEMRKKV